MAAEQQRGEEASPEARAGVSMWKFFVYSLVGAFVFFVPLEIGGKSSILLDHMVTGLESWIPGVLPYYRSESVV